jgi:protein TonB
MCVACEERGGYPFGLPFARAAATGDGAVRAAGPETAEASAVLPKRLKSAEPAYPASALRDGVEGQVIVQFQIAPDGVPHNLQILQSANAVFDQPVLRAMRQMRFEPDAPGKPPYGQRWYKQPFAFRIEQPPSGGSEP